MRNHDIHALKRRIFLKNAMGLGAVAATGALTVASSAKANTAEEIETGVADALDELFMINSGFRDVYDRAYGALVIPEIIEAGFIISGSYGEGALVINGLVDSYWSYGSAALGFQAGAQRTRLALFFMTQEALAEFMISDGFEIGAEVEATVIEDGAELQLDTTVTPRDIIAVAFGRAGLLGGASIQGGRYERIIR